MCRPTQRSAARGHNSEGSFQFIKLCWVQRLLSREFTSACVHCFVSEMTVYRNTAGFLIAWLQLTHWLCSWACRQLKTRFFFFFFLQLNDIIKVGLKSMLETRKYEYAALRTGPLNAIQRASDCNISSITMLWWQENLFEKATGQLWIWVLATRPVPFWFKQTHTHT